MSSPRPIKVAIVGGGPAGLTLAAILKKLKISHTVFELDESPSARGQGGMLDIHRNSGRMALEKAGLLDEFKKQMRVDATELYLRDRTGAVHLHHSEEGEEDPERPEIDRKVLRQILIDALEPETIQWGKKLVRSEQVVDGGSPTFALHFSDGTTAGGFDMLVGADGTWSKVRQLRSDVLPSYVGVSYISTSISNADERVPELSQFVGKGSLMAVGGTAYFACQKNGDGSLKTYAMFPTPDVDWVKNSGIDFTNQKAGLKEFAEKVFGDWDTQYKALITEGDEGEVAFRSLFELPPGYGLERKVSGVTLLGDAAHVMTPFTGVGVNLAMHDAYDLAMAIEKVAYEKASVDEAFQSYEDSMFERTSENVKETIKNQGILFSGKPIPEVVDMFLHAMGGGEA